MFIENLAKTKSNKTNKQTLKKKNKKKNYELCFVLLLHQVSMSILGINLLIKIQRIDNLGFLGTMFLVAISQLCYYNMKHED